jgi:hypothetical protein
MQIMQNGLRVGLGRRLARSDGATPTAPLTRTSATRESADRPWAQRVVIAAAYPPLSQPLLEKCFNRIFVCSTHEDSAFYAPKPFKTAFFRAVQRRFVLPNR